MSLKSPNTRIPTPSPEAALEMRRRLTLEFAAGQLAREDFPDIPELPRCLRVEGLHTGQQLLLDYDLLCRVLWGFIASVRQLAEKARRRSRLAVLTGAGFALVALALSVLASPDPLAEAAMPEAIFAAVLAFLLGRAMVRATLRSFDESADLLRVEAIATLLRYEVPACAAAYDALVPIESRQHCADGRLDKDAVLLVVSTDDARFSGFGHEVHTASLVCRAKTPPPQRPTDSALQDHIADEIKPTIGDSSGRTILSGRVLVLDGSRLTATSPWLAQIAASSAPLSPEETARLQALDHDPVSRLHAGLQLVTPEARNVITILFAAEARTTDAVFTAHILSLGPPVRGFDFAAERLSQIAYKDGDEWVVRRRPAPLDALLPSSPELFPWRSPLRRNYDRALALRSSKKFAERFRGVATFAKDEFDLSKHCGDMVADALARLQPYCHTWTGTVLYETSWRERHSEYIDDYALTRDDTAAAMLALYKLVVSAALDVISAAGYDVSEYRDKEGKLTINAGRIEQIVNAESVTLGGDRAAGDPGGSQRPGAVRKESTKWT